MSNTIHQETTEDNSRTVKEMKTSQMFACPETYTSKLLTMLTWQSTEWKCHKCLRVRNYTSANYWGCWQDRRMKKKCHRPLRVRKLLRMLAGQTMERNCHRPVRVRNHAPGKLLRMLAGQTNERKCHRPLRVHQENYWGCWQGSQGRAPLDSCSRHRSWRVWTRKSFHVTATTEDDGKVSSRGTENAIDLHLSEIQVFVHQRKR